MLMPSSASWTVRSATFALWLLAAASGVYWVLQLGGGAARSVPPPAAPRPLPAMDPEAVAGLLGGGAAAPGATPQVVSLASRLQLVGVVAGVSSGGGAAVISVDGKPARPFRVGASVDEGLVLQSVRGRRAALGPQASGPAAITLELPPIPQAQTAQPSIAQPSIAQPRIGQPPIPQPPAAQPPTAQPPTAQRPAAQPPVAQPPMPERPTPNPAPR